MCRFISGRGQVVAKKKLRTVSRLLKVGAPTPFSFMSSWNARNSSGVALSGECPRNPVKSRIARKYIVCVFGCSPLIRISSRKRRRSGGICCSDIETSCRQIEKGSIVRQVGQFAKSMPFTSARNTHHKHQYRESGFVHVPHCCRFLAFNSASAVNVCFGYTALQRLNALARSATVKVFRCGSRWNAVHWRDDDPRWKTSQGGSRGGLVSGYGESARTVAAAAVSGARLMARQAPNTASNPADDPDEAVRSGDTAALCRVGSKRARAVRTGSAECSRCCFVTVDGRYVMLPAPSVGRATSVSLKRKRRIQKKG